MKKRAEAAWIAWILAASYYFYQYALRAVPAVMMPQLSEAFGITTAAVASLAGVFYYGYSPFSLVAGAAIDRLGAKVVIPAGALITGVGAILFGTGGFAAANAGRLLQGAGGSFALVGAVYIVSKNFPASQAATLIGATQMFGMAGGSAGQFLAGPLIAAGISWKSFWIGAGIAGLAIALILFALLPGKQPANQSDNWLRALGIIFRNPQSILCGLIGGLLFLPTTIFSMTWGVRYLEEGHGFDYGDAVMRSATVPLGWIIGCPLLGALSDRIGRRKPVIIGGALVLLGGLTLILYGQPGVLPPYVLGIVAGIASGAAMLPYSVIKEANPPELAGTATGVASFLIFTLSAVLGPVFAQILQNVSGGEQRGLEHYQATFQLLSYGVLLAMLLTLFLRETGAKGRAALEVVKSI